MVLRLEQEKESSFFILISIILMFLLLTFDPDFALAFGFLATINLLIMHTFKGFKFTLLRGKNLAQTFFIGLIGFGIFTIISFIVGQATAQVQTITDVFSLFAQRTPVLGNNLAITLIAYGFIVAIIESFFFFGGLQEIISRIFKTPLKADLTNVRIWIHVMFISAIFAIFHLQSKILDLNVLWLVLVFGIVSTWMVLKFKSTDEAIALHIIANTVALLVTSGVI